MTNPEHAEAELTEALIAALEPLLDQITRPSEVMAIADSVLAQYTERTGNRTDQYKVRAFWTGEGQLSVEVVVQMPPYFNGDLI